MNDSRLDKFELKDEVYLWVTVKSAVFLVTGFSSTLVEMNSVLTIVAAKEQNRHTV